MVALESGGRYNSADEGGFMSEPDVSAADKVGDSAPKPSGADRPRTFLKVLGWAAAVIVLAALIAGGVWGLRSLNRVRSSEAAIAKASGILEEAEDDLLVVDDAVQAEISAEAATSTAEATALVDGVRESALEASEIVAAALDDLPEQTIPLARALKDSADARAEMMEIAPIILEADRQAALAIPFADQAVVEIKAAEDLSALAVAEFNKHTADGVRASDAYSVQAEGRLQVAQSLIASATASFPGADFTAFGGYIEAKISLIALAKEIDALWLAGDVAGSNTKLDAYNQRDAETVAMAQALPPSVRDPIANAYNAATTDAAKRYFEARERARSAGDRVSELRAAAAASD